MYFCWMVLRVCFVVVPIVFVGSFVCFTQYIAPRPNRCSIPAGTLLFRHLLWHAICVGLLIKKRFEDPYSHNTPRSFPRVGSVALLCLVQQAKQDARRVRQVGGCRGQVCALAPLKASIMASHPG